ncbi:MAG: 8-amino-7-oxononanoate synthase [Candidatus Firestonebacteria bacterium]
MRFFAEELDKLKKLNLYRYLRVIDSPQDVQLTINGKTYISFSSNNYLGLANYPYLKSKSIEAIGKYGCGAGASRLISGNLKIYEELEDKIAKFKNTKSSLVFPTGYMANIGAITSLVDAKDAVIIDHLNHASIIDACKQSGAKILVYSHKDLNQLEKILKRYINFRRRLIITDTIFSMDGDIAPLPEIVKLAKQNDAMLMIDDAHGTGVLGKNGKGALEYFGIDEKSVDVVMGTLSKAIGSLGGFVAGSFELIDYLRNKARSFIYTTALPAGVCGAAIAGIEMIEKEKKLNEKLWNNTKYLLGKLKEHKLNTLDSETPIIPILIGDTEKTLDIAKELFENGIFVPAIRPPTVPNGTSRLRISLTSGHTKEHLDKLIEMLKRDAETSSA